MTSQVTTSSKIVWTETWNSLKGETWAGSRMSSTSWAYLTKRSHTVDQATSLSVGESMAKGAIQQLTESLRVVDTPAKTIGGNHSESLLVLDMVAFGIGQRIAEVFDFAEEISKDAAKSLTETVEVADGNKAAKGVFLEVAQALSLIEEPFKDFSASLAELLILADGNHKQLGLEKPESFAVGDMLTKDAAVNILRDLNFDEVFDRTVAFLRSYGELLNVEGAISNGAGKNESQTFGIASAFILPANMLIADMLIEHLGVTGDYTSANFMQSLDTGALPGWTPWRTFIPGDYDYSKAMFRVVMDSISADRGYLESCMAAVDVPDVIDRGTARVTTAVDGIAVEFEREYHIIPEITLTAKGGTGTNPTAVELVGNPTLLGFTARLRDTMTGEYVTGSFTWASHGY